MCVCVCVCVAAWLVLFMCVRACVRALLMWCVAIALCVCYIIIIAPPAPPVVPLSATMLPSNSAPSQPLALTTPSPRCRLLHPSDDIIATTQRGTATFDDLQLQATPGSDCVVLVQAVRSVGSGDVCTASSQQEAASVAPTSLVTAATAAVPPTPTPRAFNVTMLPCPAGYSQSPAPGGIGIVCHRCAEGKYNVNGDGTCRACPLVGVWCSGGSDVQLARDFWATPGAEGDLVVRRCPPNFCCEPSGDHVRAPVCNVLVVRVGCSCSYSCSRVL